MTIDMESVKGAIAAKIDSAAFVSWIAPLTFEICENTLVLSAHNQFTADFVGAVHMGAIRDAIAPFGLSARVCVRNAAPARPTVANDNRVQVYAPAAAVAPATTAFDAFIPSEENDFVLSAAKKIATGAVSFSPLFIYGPAGCGKTMIAECISNASRGRVVMMTGGQFVSEFTRSLMGKNIFAFKDFCRKCDTFILDDVQAVSGKRASAEELFQLILDLRAAGKNIVLTANVTPGNLSGFDRQMQSVMASGLVADMAAPSAVVRRKMLVAAGVADSVAGQIAGRISDNGHMVAGVATKINTYAELMNAPVDAAVAGRLLADTLKKSKTPISMVRDMCEKLGVSYDAVCGAGRTRGLVLARQTMMAVLKGATKLSLAEIGQYVGGRDHATVVYALGQVEKNKATDLVLAAQIDQMIAEYK